MAAYITSKSSIFPFFITGAKIMVFIEDTKYMAGNFENCKKCNTFAPVKRLIYCIRAAADARPNFLIMCIKQRSWRCWHLGLLGFWGKTMY